MRSLKEENKDPEHVVRIKKEIYRASVSLGGVITGEHGIGKIRIKEISLVLSEKQIHLMREIKRLFDPNNILNPGKVLPPR